MPGAAQGQGMSHEGGKPVIVGQSTGRRKIVRRLAAVLGADISGYSTLMAGNEEGTHRRVGSAMTRLAREIEKSYRRVFSFAGDGRTAEFPSAGEALKMRAASASGCLQAQCAPAEGTAHRIPHGHQFR